MQKRKRYERTRFTPDTLKAAVSTYLGLIPADWDSKNLVRNTFEVTRGPESWTYNKLDEYIADLRRGGQMSSEIFLNGPGPFVFTASVRPDYTSASIGADNREQIESVFEVFERAALAARIPDPPRPAPSPKPPEKKPIVFIGHGRSKQWRDLKDHLTDKHGVQVEAYEVGSRAGHAVRDILDEMMSKSTMALLVLTAEDEAGDGGKRARQNVVHETGLFQGRLGFSRAIVLLEEGAEEFSNIHGIDQLRYSAGNIKEVFGDVLAALRREFPKALA